MSIKPRAIKRPVYTYADYEAAKREWSFRNPSATHEQYERAMRDIATRMGL